MRKRTQLTLLAYVSTYIGQREMTPVHAENLHRCAGKLSKFAGRVLKISEIESELVNAWIVSMLASGLAPHSVCNYRGAILAVWNAAYVDRLNDEPPLRVRKVKKPRLTVEAYSHAEISQLLAGASRLRGFDVNGSRRSDFWQAVIHAAYSTGLRRGDLLNVPRASVADDGLCTHIQHKTGYPVTVRFSTEALEFAAKLQSPRKLLIDWPGRCDTFHTGFNCVLRKAGIERGSLKWLRRSAGSYAESVQTGAGARLLGHRDPGVFHRHYEAWGISSAKPVEPPAIAPPIRAEVQP